ncbi:MAG: phage head-tail adapter protein [Dehalococcoidia bacterium]|nr:MAG: phage head-tail adapter protein [Dehalococcoidia bacterium]
MSNAKQIIKRYERLKSDRGTLESHWQEIAERVMPNFSGAFDGSDDTKGDKRTSKMFDATASHGLERFAAAMESMLTPRNSKWHRLTPSDPVLAKSRNVSLWFEEVTRLLFAMRYSPRANFASQMHEKYMSLGAFGTAGMFVDERAGGGIRYHTLNLARVFFAENHDGIVDTMFRTLEYTARQAVQRWGKDRLPPAIVSAFEKDPDKPFKFLHAVMPREDVQHGRMDYKGMPFASYYVALDTQSVVSEGGYHAFPVPISRYVTGPGEVYGRSPAMLALPAIKTLNEQKKTLLKQGHRAVDPVLLLADDGVISTFNMRPGALNHGAMTAEGKRLVDILPTGNVAVGHQMMEMERQDINEAFLVTLFQILVDTPQMTATEVLERAREKGALLSPTMGRQQSESLGPLIERELDIMARQGLLPEMPPELVEAQGEYTIEYDSPLSRAQKAEEAAGMFRAMEFATAYATQTGDPSAFDHIDVDIAMPEIMTINAVPERWKRSAESIQALREQRAQTQQTQQMIEAAPAVSSVIKTQSQV